MNTLAKEVFHIVEYDGCMVYCVNLNSGQSAGVLPRQALEAVRMIVALTRSGRKYLRQIIDVELDFHHGHATWEGCLGESIGLSNEVEGKWTVVCEMGRGKT